MFSLDKTVFFVDCSAGLVNGTVGEYLFSSVNDRKVSYLEWQEANIPFINVNSGINAYNSTFEVNLQYRIPVQSGMMTDSDWKLKNVKTNYGVFNNFTDYNNYKIDLNYGYLIKFNSSFSLKPCIQFSFNHYGFYTDTGYGWYGENCAWDSADAVYHPKLSHIEYIQQQYNVFTGIDFLYTRNRLTLGFNTSVSPVLLNYTIDYHADDNKTSSIEYTTYSKQLSFFYAYKTGVKLEYKVTGSSSITAGFNCLFTLVSKGATVYKADKPDERFGLFEKLNEWDTLGQNTGNRIFETGFNLGYKVEF